MSGGPVHTLASLHYVTVQFRLQGCTTGGETHQFEILQFFSHQVINLKASFSFQFLSLIEIHRQESMYGGSSVGVWVGVREYVC